MSKKNINEVVFTEDQYEELFNIIVGDKLGTIHKTQLFADCFEDNLDLFNAWKDEFIGTTVVLTVRANMDATFQYEVDAEDRDVETTDWLELIRGGEIEEPSPEDQTDHYFNSVEDVNDADERTRLFYSFNQYLIETGQHKWIG